MADAIKRINAEHVSEDSLSLLLLVFFRNAHEFFSLVNF